MSKSLRLSTVSGSAMPFKRELKSGSQKKKQSTEAAPSSSSSSSSSSSEQESQRQTPANFWDKLSRVPLCHLALREFNRRVTQPIAPKPHRGRVIEVSRTEQLKRFARRGGPDLCSIRGYLEQETRAGMPLNRRRTKRPSTLDSAPDSDPDSTTKPTTLTPKHPAFEQALVDNGVYPPGFDEIEPDNLEEISERLGQRRASLTPSKFSREEFLNFKRRNDRATTEAEIMTVVFPVIVGQMEIPYGFNQVFNNLKPLADRISTAQPDYYNGSRPAEIRVKIRDSLGKSIIPSIQPNRQALPNLFFEAKGPDGKPSHAKRQITQDLALGARGMLMIQSYKLEEAQFDNKAYSFGATYNSGTGTLQLYAMHPTELTKANGHPEYHATQITAFALTANPDICRQGIGAYRNLQDLAKERRDEFIACANERADNKELDSDGKPDSDEESNSTSVASTEHIQAPQLSGQKRKR